MSRSESLKNIKNREFASLLKDFLEFGGGCLFNLKEESEI